MLSTNIVVKMRKGCTYLYFVSFLWYSLQKLYPISGRYKCAYFGYENNELSHCVGRLINRLYRNPLLEILMSNLFSQSSEKTGFEE